MSDLKVGSIVWGVTGDVRRAVEFWCAALDYKPLRELSEDWAILAPAKGEGHQMAIMQVKPDTGDGGNQRHHLDLYATDRKAEVERLVSIGAQRVERRYPEGADYVILADPDGNTFCVVQKSE